MTDGEAHLWNRLRDHSIMQGWESQVPFRYYTLDFYTPKARLAVEADGYHHWNARKQIQRDVKRERFFTKEKIAVMRFSNRQILERTDIVLGEILAEYLRWLPIVNGPEIEWYREKARSVR